MINDAKTEFIIIGSKQQLSNVSISGIKVGSTIDSPSLYVRNLCCWFDTNLNVIKQIISTCSCYFFIIFIILGEFGNICLKMA